MASLLEFTRAAARALSSITPSITLPFFSTKTDDGILLISNLNLSKIWAPDDRIWSDWAKPVLPDAPFEHDEAPHSFELALG
jgi:hypothetical protein